MLAQWVTAIPGSSEGFLGSLVTYSNSAKQELLGVPAAVLEPHGAVSAETAAAMAAGARRRLGADVAVAITGVAGPDGGSEAKPVGLVYVHLSSPAGEESARRPDPRPGAPSDTAFPRRHQGAVGKSQRRRGGQAGHGGATHVAMPGGESTDVVRTYGGAGQRRRASAVYRPVPPGTRARSCSSTTPTLTDATARRNRRAAPGRRALVGSEATRPRGPEARRRR